MSFNRLRYDNCAYKQELNESVGTLAYVLDPSRFENCNKCTAEGGVGRDTISYGELVNIENELRNQTAATSVCPSKKHNPKTAKKGVSINEPSICNNRVQACKNEGKGFKEGDSRYCC